MVVEYNPKTMRFSNVMSSVKTCLCCGRKLIDKPRGQKFCNNSCRMKYAHADPNSAFNSEEYRAKKSEITKAIHKDPNSVFNTDEYRAKKSKSVKIVWATPDSKYNSEECRAKKSKSMKAAYADPNSKYNSEECRAKHRESRLCQRLPKNGTSIERAIEGVLEEIGVAYIPSFRLDKYKFDEALPEYGILIECDGEYWHGLSEAVENDKRKDRVAYEKGWTLLRFSGMDIQKNLDHCRKVIQEKIREREFSLV